MFFLQTSGVLRTRSGSLRCFFRLTRVNTTTTQQSQPFNQERQKFRAFFSPPHSSVHTQSTWASVLTMETTACSLHPATHVLESLSKSRVHVQYMGSVHSPHLVHQASGPLLALGYIWHRCLNLACYDLVYVWLRFGPQSEYQVGHQRPEFYCSCGPKDQVYHMGYIKPCEDPWLWEAPVTFLLHHQHSLYFSADCSVSREL